MDALSAGTVKPCTTYTRIPDQHRTMTPCSIPYQHETIKPCTSPTDGFAVVVDCDTYATAANQAILMVRLAVSNQESNSCTLSRSSNGVRGRLVMSA